MNKALRFAIKTFYVLHPMLFFAYAYFDAIELLKLSQTEAQTTSALLIFIVIPLLTILLYLPHILLWQVVKKSD